MVTSLERLVQRVPCDLGLTLSALQVMQPGRRAWEASVTLIMGRAYELAWDSVLDSGSMLLKSVLIEKIVPTLLANPFGLRNLSSLNGDFKPLAGMKFIVQVLIKCSFCAKMLVTVAADVVSGVYRGFEMLLKRVNINEDFFASGAIAMPCRFLMEQQLGLRDTAFVANRTRGMQSLSVILKNPAFNNEAAFRTRWMPGCAVGLKSIR